MEYFVPGKGKVCEKCAFRGPDLKCKEAIIELGIMTSPEINTDGSCKTFQPNTLAVVVRGRAQDLVKNAGRIGQSLCIF